MVYSWEPIVCHDSLDMGWSTLGDICINDGKLIGCSYYHNSVAALVADTWVYFHNQVLLVKMYNYLCVKLIGQHVPNILDEEKTCMPSKFNLQKDLTERVGSPRKSTMSPDDDKKDIKNINVDSMTPVASKKTVSLPTFKSSMRLLIWLPLHNLLHHRRFQGRMVDVETQHGFIPVERMRVIDFKGELQAHREFQPQAREKAEKEEFEIISAQGISGSETAIIEGDVVGGTCVNHGCVPSKALLAVAAAGYDRQGGPLKVKFGKAGGTETVITAKNIIVATGSVPFILKGVEVDCKTVITSHHALKLETVPEWLVIVVSGYIGFEFSDIYTAPGSEVTIFLVNQISIVKIQVTTISSLRQPGVIESSRRFNGIRDSSPFNISSTGNSGSSLPSRRNLHSQYLGQTYRGPILSPPNYSPSFKFWWSWMSFSDFALGSSSIVEENVVPSRGRLRQPLIGAGSVMEVPGDEWQAFASDIEGRRMLVSEDCMIFDPFINGVSEMHDRHLDMKLDVDNMSYEVYSWEPIICHDSLDMGWSTLGDICTNDGKLIGCSYYHNSVAAWVADTWHVSNILAEEKTCMPPKFNLQKDLTERVGSPRSSTMFPDDDTKDIKNIYVDISCQAAGMTPVASEKTVSLPTYKSPMRLIIRLPLHNLLHHPRFQGRMVDVETQHGFVPVDERMRVIDSKGELLTCIAL
ncbi:hypothetical protein L2E82_01565 [Cichorium intybus]|uniref:Uncharacterized protein n=1 Tax=Cichorium intybus TaxID=13427 RepID=A0ACB9GZ85_CICIN|nr:hypothetical protein L2E82_01565 [Cichorium intybus]